VPHIAHRLWFELGHRQPVIDAPWPQPEAAARVADTVLLVVQINGKRRGEITVPADAAKESIVAAALADPNVQKFLDGQPIKKTIVVPGKLLNFVV
jgi:leucyl-tRNA synthetase